VCLRPCHCASVDPAQFCHTEQENSGPAAAGELPIDFIPFDGDVLSLELDTAFRARALMRRRFRTAAQAHSKLRCKGKT